jgi:hypothetical protein
MENEIFEQQDIENKNKRTFYDKSKKQFKISLLGFVILFGISVLIQFVSPDNSDHIFVKLTIPFLLLLTGVFVSCLLGFFYGIRSILNTEIGYFVKLIWVMYVHLLFACIIVASIMALIQFVKNNQ